MIKHVLKDGTVVKDISGHLVKADESEVYQIISRINERMMQSEQGRTERKVG